MGTINRTSSKHRFDPTSLRRFASSSPMVKWGDRLAEGTHEVVTDDYIELVLAKYALRRGPALTARSAVRNSAVFDVPTEAAERRENVRRHNGETRES